MFNFSFFYLFSELLFCVVSQVLRTECFVNFVISHSKKASLHVVPDDTFHVCVPNN